MKAEEQLTPIIPDGQELIARIKRHLEDRPGDDRMVLLWLRFVAGLSEFGMLDRKVTDEIYTKVLPNTEPELFVEICLGTRAEQAKEQEDIRKENELAAQRRAQFFAERDSKKAASFKAGSES
jgi:hypothetical protein